MFDTCVILAAGKSKRFGGCVPKVLVKLRDKPLIQYVIDYWKPFVKTFVFVVGYKSGEVIDAISKIPMTKNTGFVFQP
jgi:choline kinase